MTEVDPVLDLIRNGIRYHQRREKVGESFEGQKWSVDGHYVSDDPDLKLLSEFFEAEVPQYEAALLNHLTRYGTDARAVSTIALLGWGKNYPAITMTLRSFLGGECHEIHTMAARTLHPLVAADKIPLGHIGVDRIYDLMTHSEPQCAYRGLRILTRSYSLFAAQERNFLASRKTMFQRLYSEHSHIGVRDLAKGLVTLILEDPGIKT